MIARIGHGHGGSIMPRKLLVVSVAIASLAWGACATDGGSTNASEQAVVPRVEVTASSLNVREAPSTSAAIVGSLGRGERVAAPEAEADGWLRIESETGVRGFVAARFVSVVPTAGGAETAAPKTAAPEPEVSPAVPEDASAAQPSPSGSRLARIRLEMSESEVVEILGAPTSQDSYTTGKQWIPFYYGPDTHRLDYKYRGEGVVVFGRNRYSGNTRVIRVDYDPAEDGQ